MTIYNKLHKPQHGGDKYLKSQHSEGRVRQAGPKIKISMGCRARFKKKKKKKKKIKRNNKPHIQYLTSKLTCYYAFTPT